MHIEFHYPVSPWVDVHIRIVAIGDRCEHAVNILTDIVADVRHTNQPRTPNNRSRASITITPARHVQIVRRSHPYCGLEGSQTNSIVSANCTDRSVTPNKYGGAVEHIRDLSCVSCVGIMIPCVVSDSLRAQFIKVEHFNLFFNHFIAAKAARKHRRQNQQNDCTYRTSHE